MQSDMSLDLTPLKAIENVDGWLYEPEALFLHDLARGVRVGCIVEIGSYRGRSTIMLAQGARKAGAIVYAIDPHLEAIDGIATYSAADRDVFIENIQKAGLTDIVRKLDMTSSQAVEGWRESIGMLWIDGAHDYESVKQDVKLWTPHVIDGGIVAFHDSGFESVQRAQAELPSSYQLIAQVNSTRAYQKHSIPRTGVDVSVIIPAYNAENIIAQAVNSALLQLGVSVEAIVCVDGGDIEATNDAIAHGMVNTAVVSDRTRFTFCWHETNRGQCHALNTAAEHATGRYIIELDADDWLEPGALAALVSALDAAPEYVGFAYGCVQYHGDLNAYHQPRPYKRGDFYRSFPALYPFMYRRDAWDAGCRYTPHGEVNGRGLSIQDWDMALQLIEYMRYDGIALRDTLVLHYNYRAGEGVGAQLKALQGSLMPAFRKRWPKVIAEGL